MPAHLPVRRTSASTISTMLALLSLSTGVLVAADAPPPAVTPPATEPAPPVSGAPQPGTPPAPVSNAMQAPPRPMSPMPPIGGFKPPDFTLRLLELGPTGAPTDDSQKVIEDMVAENWRPLTITTVSATDPIRVVMMFQRNPPRMPGRPPMMRPAQQGFAPGGPPTAGGPVPPAPEPAAPAQSPAPAPAAPK
jgi:pyruvate dehydrogenase E2 component (dihydrolipoamide acetyltransferase)